MTANNSSENSSADSSSEYHSEGHHSQDNKFYINLETLNEDSLKIYPERRGGTRDKGFYENLFGNRDTSSRLRCERHVSNIVAKNPLIKLLLSALKSHGCEFDLTRHVACESCNYGVTGGYDPHLNQIVVCHNRTTKNTTQGVLAHELIHMFDFCRAKFDFNNIEHVACSEIRAANLVHCSFISALFQGTGSFLNMAKTHRLCVKAKAVSSILLFRKDMPREEAWEVVDRVFDRCYNDLEPIGRRIRRGSKHMEWAYRERYHYNYDSF